MIDKIIDLLLNKKTLGENIFAKNYKEEYEYIIKYTKHFNPSNWAETKYIFINQLKELPKCKICNNITRFYPSMNRYMDTCCRECDKKLKSESHYRYWDKAEQNNTKNQIIQKSLNKKLDRYGYKSPFETETVKIKCKESMLNKFGVENYFLTDEFKDKFNDKEWVKEIQDKKFITKKNNGTLYISRKEMELKKFIESLGVKTEKKRIYNNEIDIYCPEYNIGVEFNGSYWHSINGGNMGKINRSYHSNKFQICQENNIRLIHIWEDEWDYKNEIIKDILRSVFNKQSNKIYARQCIIKEVNNIDYKNFCIEHHLQGYRPAKYIYGLYYNNELVQICSFTPCKIVKGKKPKYEYEWIRGCFASNNAVIGGTSKLLNHFIKQNNPKSILCYADRNKFNGESYIKSGFILDGIVPQDKFYIDINTGLRINRNPVKYREYTKMVEEGKLLLCFGAGSYRFVWYK